MIATMFLIVGIVMLVLASYMRYSHGKRAYDRYQQPRPSYNKMRLTQILENLYQFVYYLLFAVGFILVLFYLVDRYH